MLQVNYKDYIIYYLKKAKQKKNTLKALLVVMQFCKMISIFYNNH